MNTLKHMACVLLAMLAAACSKDDLVPEPALPADNGLVEMTFTAAAAPHTRTSLGSKDETGVYPVLWTAGDEIAVMPQTEEYEQSEIAKMKFTTSINKGETAATATFTGSTYASDNGYIAFYPHCNLILFAGSTYYHIFFFTIPTEQKAVAGSFAPNICPAYALQEDDKLTFNSICGLVKFRLSGDVSGLESVRFEAAGQPLTGENTYPPQEFLQGLDSEQHVTLTGSFVAGNDYYMVVQPCDLGKGFSFTFTKSDGRIYIKEGVIENGEIVFGQIGNFGEIVLSDAAFTKPSENDIADMAFINAVEAGSTPKIEFIKNGSGYVSLTDENKELMASVTELDLFGKGLTDASALKYFTGLTNLVCSSNSFTTLDVSGMTNLTYLDCGDNQLTKLTVNGATALETLYCYRNQLTTLDVSELTELKKLNCSENKLTELTVSGATALELLDCSHNELTGLDVSELTNLTYLYCTSNKLTTLAVQGAAQLAELLCSYNSIQKLDASGLEKLSRLVCYSNQLTELNVSGLTNLTTLQCFSNQLTELNVSGLTKLTTLQCSSNQLSALDVTGVTVLETLNCSDNNLEGLNVSELTTLKYLFCAGNFMKELDISEIDLTQITCGRQTSDGTTPQTLTLTLTAEQKDGVWDRSNPNNNNNKDVVLNVI